MSYGLREERSDVYYAESHLPVIGREIVEFLKAKAAASPRRVCRLCTHEGTEDPFQEMLIAHCRDTYMRPHKHVGHARSYKVLEGRAIVVVFRPDGQIDTAFELDAAGPYYFRVRADVYYMFLAQTDFFVFIEATTGPWVPHETARASWAPPEGDEEAAAVFRSDVAARARGIVQAAV